jgi:NAD(P)H dehydrogenase (quinone)
MKILMVISHPEPTSFSHALAQTGKKTLEAQGHEVQVSDLYAMKWDPVNDRRNFLTVKNAERFHQATEELHALENNGINPQMKGEMNKIEWCDVLFFYFPINWFGLPAMLKSWVDKIFACGFAYGQGKWYDKGIFLGKKAMLVVTTGAPEFMYKHDHVQGDINDIFFPVNHGIFYFCGFTPLEPFYVYSPSHVTQEDREKMLQSHADYLRDINSIKPIQYRTLADINSTAGVVSIPAKATHMITVTNAAMRSWAENDEVTYKKCIDTEKFQMVIPAYQLDVTGFQTVWGVRQSLGPVLHPHLQDSHVFPEPHTIKCYAHVIDPATGERTQLAEITYTFDSLDQVLVKYHQHILYMRK